MIPDNRPRPYTTLRDGRIIWVAPVEHTPGRAKRSRLETDAEVRSRFLAAGKWYYPELSGAKLDAQLKYWGLLPRQYVDVEV